MTVEEAYNLLATELMEFVAGTKWDTAGSVSKIYQKMTQTSYWRRWGSERAENDRFPSLATAGPASRAALFLRDNLLHTTGARIWGLTFTLYPDGKFNIEYDYNKPEGYEETDETVEVNLSGLQNITKDK